eukprot:403356264
MASMYYGGASQYSNQPPAYQQYPQQQYQGYPPPPYSAPNFGGVGLYTGIPQNTIPNQQINQNYNPYLNAVNQQPQVQQPQYYTNQAPQPYGVPQQYQQFPPQHINQSMPQYPAPGFNQYMTPGFQQAPPDMYIQTSNQNQVDTFLKGVVTQTVDSLGDRNAFEEYLQRFETEYIAKNAQRTPKDRTPSPVRRSQSDTFQRSRSASPLYTQENYAQMNHQSHNGVGLNSQPAFNLSNQNPSANLKNLMPTQTEKQRAIYTDPHVNSNGLLMNDRRNNDPLNFRDMQNQMSQIQSQQQLGYRGQQNLTQRESPTKSAAAFYDFQQDARTSRSQQFANQNYAQQQQQIPNMHQQQHQQQKGQSQINLISQLGGLPDTVGSMQKSLEKYELASQSRHQQQYDNLSQNRRSVSPLSQQQQNIPPNSYTPTRGGQYDQSISYEQAQQIHNTYLPSISVYKRDEQRIKMMQILNQPQLKTTLTSSQYLRELREQSLRQIQNWDHVQTDYQEKLRKKQEELAAANQKPGATAETGNRVRVAYGISGPTSFGRNITPTTSASQFMRM